MELNTYVRDRILFALNLREAAMTDITEEQFNWLPPDTANPVRASFLHMVGNEDFSVNAYIRGGRSLWQSGGWAEKIGLAIPPGRGENWEGARDRHVPLDLALEYARVVRASVETYLDELKDVDLDRMVTARTGQRSVGDILGLIIAHTPMHAGEIAAVRGMQGVKGLPF